MVEYRYPEALCYGAYISLYESDVMTSTTMTIRVSLNAANVDRELEIIEGVKAGLADMDAGCLVSHEDAMAEIYAAIDTAGPARKA